jgi:hypothetical protein
MARITPCRRIILINSEGEDDPHVSEFHSWLVEAPFHKHIVFYRFNSDMLSLERLIHGARDLPRRIHMAPYDEERE